MIKLFMKKGSSSIYDVGRVIEISLLHQPKLSFARAYLLVIQVYLSSNQVRTRSEAKAQALSQRGTLCVGNLALFECLSL